MVSQITAVLEYSKDYTLENGKIIGIIEQVDGDQGDSLHREGLLLFIIDMLSRHNMIEAHQAALLNWRGSNTIRQLVDKSGYIRRGIKDWAKDWDRGSRDQLHAIIGIGLNESTRDIMYSILKNQAKRGFLFTTNIRPNTSDPSSKTYGELSWKNPKDWAKKVLAGVSRIINSDKPYIKMPDLTLMGMWGVYIRLVWNDLITSSSNLKRLSGIASAAPVWILLNVLDLSLVGNSALRVYWKSRDKKEVDSSNHVQCLILAENIMATPLSVGARLLYTNMPERDAAGIAEPVSDNPVQQEFDIYFAKENGGAPFNKLIKPLIRYYFGA